MARTYARINTQEEEWESKYFVKLRHFRAKCKLCVPSLHSEIVILVDMHRIHDHFKRGHINIEKNKLANWIFLNYTKDGPRMKCSHCDYVCAITRPLPDVVIESILSQHLLRYHKIISSGHKSFMWDLFYKKHIIQLSNGRMWCTKCERSCYIFSKIHLKEHIRCKHPEIRIT